LLPRFLIAAITPPDWAGVEQIKRRCLGTHAVTGFDFGRTRIFNPLLYQLSYLAGKAVNYRASALRRQRDLARRVGS